MDAFDPSFDDWASDHVLSGANWNEEEYNSRIVQSPLNASLAGDTDSLIITASFMASWADRGVASVSHGFFDPQEICKQAQFYMQINKILLVPQALFYPTTRKRAHRFHPDAL
jgi:hypothetical protein